MIKIELLQIRFPLGDHAAFLEENGYCLDIQLLFILIEDIVRSI